VPLVGVKIAAKSCARGGALPRAGLPHRRDDRPVFNVSRCRRRWPFERDNSPKLRIVQFGVHAAVRERSRGRRHPDEVEHREECRVISAPFTSTDSESDHEAVDCDGVRTHESMRSHCGRYCAHGAASRPKHEHEFDGPVCEWPTVRCAIDGGRGWLWHVGFRADLAPHDERRSWRRTPEVARPAGSHLGPVQRARMRGPLGGRGVDLAGPRLRASTRVVQGHCPVARIDAPSEAAVHAVE
jgi:hypothetical protein